MKAPEVLPFEILMFKLVIKKSPTPFLLWSFREKDLLRKGTPRALPERPALQCAAREASHRAVGWVPGPYCFWVAQQELACRVCSVLLSYQQKQPFSPLEPQTAPPSPLSNRPHTPEVASLPWELPWGSPGQRVNTWFSPANLSLRI